MLVVQTQLKCLETLIDRVSESIHKSQLRSMNKLAVGEISCHVSDSTFEDSEITSFVLYHSESTVFIQYVKPYVCYMLKSNQ